LPDIVFMGTPDFAVPSFEALVKAGYHLSLLVSQPDRKKGRGQKLQHTPTKIAALEKSIEVFQPESIREPQHIEKLRSMEADFFVVIAYGKILPPEILSLPKKACINVHASLLPKWRGAAPIQFSLLEGDKKTGVATMLMDKGMDTGDLLQVRETEIKPDENAGVLGERLALMGAELIVETIERFDSLVPQKQDSDKATYTRLLKKEDRFINWDMDAEKVYGQFRALSPFPGVVTLFREKRLVLNSMKRTECNHETGRTEPGEIVALEQEGFQVACRSGFVAIGSCRPESKKELAAKDFYNGYQVKPGEKLVAKGQL
jgi:methionyl-tRNA formyltransferase